MLFLPALDITEIQFFELFRKSCENNHTRGVGTGNRGGDKFSENTKSALSGGKVPFAFVKMFVQIAFFMILQLFVLQKTQKMSSLRWQAPFAFVKNVVQIAFYMIAIIFPLPPPSRCQHFREKNFRCMPFSFQNAPRNRPPPQSFDAPMPLIHTPPPDPHPSPFPAGHLSIYGWCADLKAMLTLTMKE